MSESLLNFPFPLRGFDTGWARVEQPPQTSPDLLNVMPYDLSGRARGGVRPGTLQCIQKIGAGVATQFPADANGIRFIQGMAQTDAAGADSSAHSYLIVACAGKLYAATDNYVEFVQFTGGGAAVNVPAYSGGQMHAMWVRWDPTAGTVYGPGLNSGAWVTPAGYGAGTGGGTSLRSNRMVEIVPFQQKIFVLDTDTNIKQADVSTLAFEAFGTGYTAAGTPPKWCRIGAIYRNRLVVAAQFPEDGSAALPQNVYASRQGNPADWNYAGTDPASAWALNASSAGQIGDAVTALVPLSDDYMLIGGAHSIWRMTGDPTDGGALDPLSTGVGFLNNEGWCMDPDGNVYFVGTGGFYVITRGGFEIRNLSANRANSFFLNLGTAGKVVQCEYDRDRHGVWIFIIPADNGTGSAGTFLWYDVRTDGFFPMQFPDAWGPTAAVVYDTLGGVDRQVLMGSWDGRIHKFYNTGLTDDGSTISSYAYIGPVRPENNEQQAKLNGLDVTLGETPTGLVDANWNVNYALQCGNTAYQAYSAPQQTLTGTFTAPGRQGTLGVRMTGSNFFLKLANSTNGKYWGIDEASAGVDVAGRERGT